MTETLSDLITPSGVAVSFSFTPAGTFTYTSPSGLVLSAPSAAHNTSLTFTATATIYNQGSDLTGPLTIIEYRWDFGDGVYGYGNGATHTYKLQNVQAVTKLRVTDSKGRQWFTRAQMYLT